MKRKRRHLTAEFKARIAAEAFRGEKSIQKIAVSRRTTLEKSSDTLEK